MKRKTIKITLFIFIGILSVNTSAQNSNNELSNHTGHYFGQTPPGKTPVIFAPGFISTDQFEFCGTFSEDGSEFFFTRRNDYQGASNRIYYTKMTDNKWTKPKLAPIAKNTFEFEPGITPDGKKLYFYSERSDNRDSKYDGDLWVSEKTITGWSEAKYFLSPVNKKWCMGVSSSLDGTLYFASSYDGKRGIFRCKPNADGKYLDIEYLPNEINSIGGAHAFISPDESFLIFDAQVSGRGMPELFISFQKTDGSWTQAINMGSEINATKTEFGASISPDGKYLFFHRRVNGNGDIYWVSTDILRTLKSEALEQA